MPATTPPAADRVFTVDEACKAAGRLVELSQAVGVPYPQWGRRCHEISLKLLRTGRFGRGRVARGWCPGVDSQHSWIVLGDDVYDPNAIIVDPTVHAYVPEAFGIYVQYIGESPHRPHGYGYRTGISDVLDAEARDPDAYENVDLTPASPLSPVTLGFLDALLPLSRAGWAVLAEGPMCGWASGEIIAAMADTDELRALVPIDILGMVTDRNPSQLYR
jgi:hypothetical protein